MKLFKDFSRYYLRNGRLFYKCLKELEETEKYSLQELQEYQNEKLRRIIKIAYENVPFYRRIFIEKKLTPRDIGTIEDLKKLPIIDKQKVRENFIDFKNKKFKRFIFKGYTTGTTGSPAVFLRDLFSINFENAALWRQYRWAGKDFGNRRITLRGEKIFPSSKKKPPFWRYNHFSRELIMSSYHLSDENMWLYIEEIKKYKPFDLDAYPSTAYILANFCKRFNVDLNFTAVFTSSEMLLDYQREEIESTFGCKVFDSYGNAERVAVIGECEYGVYHEMSDYSIIEYLPQEQGQYQIVGTTLHNSVMPLIRYRTGDLVFLDGNKSCHCGRSFREIKSILGRNDDFIITPDGRRIPGLSNLFKGVEFLKEAQLIQKGLNFIEVNIAVTDRYSKEYENTILKKLHEYIGMEGINYSIKNVDHIEREAGGKFKFVKNLINKDSNS